MCKCPTGLYEQYNHSAICQDALRYCGHISFPCRFGMQKPQANRISSFSARFSFIFLDMLKFCKLLRRTCGNLICIKALLPIACVLS